MTKEELKELIEKWDNLNYITTKITYEPQCLDILIETALDDSNPKAWRAAWIADQINAKHPELVRPYIEKFISLLKPHTNSSVKRHLLKLISLHPMPEEHISFLLN